MRAARKAGDALAFGNNRFETVRKIRDRVTSRNRQCATVGTGYGADLADFAGRVAVEVDRVRGACKRRAEHQSRQQQCQPAAGVGAGS